MRGSHLLPSQLPGEHTGHEAASRHSEPIWNAHIPPITLIAGTHFTYPGRDGRLSQPVESAQLGLVMYHTIEQCWQDGHPSMY